MLGSVTGSTACPGIGCFSVGVARSAHRGAGALDLATTELDRVLKDVSGPTLPLGTRPRSRTIW
jgi:hypothetical protein